MVRTQNLSFIGVVRATDGAILALHIDQEDQLATEEIKRHLYSGPSSMREAALGQSRHMDHWSRGPIFFWADDNMVYCLGAKDRGYPERVAFACLAKLKEITSSKTSSMIRSTGVEGALNRSIGKDMSNLMGTYDRLEEVDKIAAVQKNVDATKDVVRQNVEKLAAQAATLEGLEDRSGQLNQQSQNFHKDATTLRKKMQWRNAKVYIIGAVIVAIIIGYLIWVFTDGGSEPTVDTNTGVRRLTLQDFYRN